MIVPLQGNLTAEVLGRQLQTAKRDFQESKILGMVVDARMMTAYEAEARELFVQWHREHRHLVRRIAIVTRNPLWHMVIRAMSLAAGVPMHPFGELAPAIEWARAPA